MYLCTFKVSVIGAVTIHLICLKAYSTKHSSRYLIDVPDVVRYIWAEIARPVAELDDIIMQWVLNYRLI